MSGDAHANKGWSMFSGSPAGTPEKPSRKSVDGSRPKVSRPNLGANFAKPL